MDPDNPLSFDMFEKDKMTPMSSYNVAESNQTKVKSHIFVTDLDLSST